MSESFRQQLYEILTEQRDRLARSDCPLQVPPSAATYQNKRPFHFHPLPELFVQLSGGSRMRTPRAVTRCPADGLMLIPRGVPHQEWTERTDTPFRNIVIAFGRRTLSIHEAQQGEKDHPRIMALEQFVSDDVERLCEYLDTITEWNRNESQQRDTVTRGLLMAFFGLLLSNMDDPSIQQRGESHKVVHCRRMVSEHLANPDLNVHWLAGRIACAPDYLSHLFSTETGIRLTQYINAKRIDFACRLLTGSVLNVAEIAHACGYHDPGYMTRQFRRLVGCTPRAYRRQLAARDHTVHA